MGIAISGGSATAANAGTTPLTFTVTLASAAAGADFTAASGTLTLAFNAGETSKAISVSVRNDTLVEPDETFSVRLSSASGATIATGTGVGTIVNDDGLTAAVRQAAFVALAVAEAGANSSAKPARR